MSRVTILGAGAVGTRVARHLLADGSADPPNAIDRVLLRDVDPERLTGALALLDRAATEGRVEVEHAPFPAELDADVVVVATPRGTQVAAVKSALSAGVPVVLSGDGLAETVAVARLADDAHERGVPVVLGAGFTPGLSCVLAAHACSWFDQVDEIHVAKAGAGGPACAVVHHRALSRLSYDWQGGDWRRRPGGSGRELCWFPEPVGPMDCYRAALPDPVLLHHAFPEVGRITARMAASRIDRLTAPLPMLSPTHVEGGVGAVRVEVRGRRGTTQDVCVLGVAERPAVAAAAVAATTVEWALADRLRVRGMAGLAEMVEPVAFISEVADRGLVAEIFEGEHAVV